MATALFLLVLLTEMRIKSLCGNRKIVLSIFLKLLIWNTCLVEN